MIVRHECDDFRGARDVWLGQVAGGREEGDRFLAEQLLVRGVLWVLHEKQALSADELRARFAKLDAIEPPPPLPANLPVVESPRPWGDTFLPKSKPPAQRLLAVDFAKLKPDERIAITCLQGLTSREQPRLWLLRNLQDREWLEWHKTKGHIESYEIVADWTSLFRDHRDVVRGAVIADPQLYRGDLLAVNVAACEDSIVATPELAERLALPVKVDLRGRFTTYAEGQRWVWANYQDRLSHHLADYFAPKRMTEGTFAYQYQWRAPLVWPCGPKDERQPGADRFAEKRAVAEMFAGMVPNSPILGFPFGGEGIGLGEPPGVELASRYGRPLVCSDYLANLCVTSGVRLDRLTQPAPPPAPSLERDKIYIALAMSDGDNLNAWLKFFRQYFEHPSHGKFPLAFGMGPALREVMPAVAQWYFERATPLNEFICDVSGAGYIQPPNFGLAFTDRERVWSGFLDWTARMLPPLGMRTVRPVEGDDTQLARYARALPFCHSIFADMGCYSGHRGIANLTYTLPGGMPVFRAATTWRTDGGGPLGEVREHVGTQRPAFVNAFVHCWTFKPDDVARIVAEADPDMVFVTPSQLAALYRTAHDQPAAP